MNLVTEASVCPFPRSGFDPPAEYAWLRQERPVSQVTVHEGKKAWLITRHEDVRAILADRRVSADRSHPGFPILGPSGRANAGRSGIFIFMDPPKHRFLRGMIAREFTAKRMQEMSPQVERTINDLIDRMLAITPPVDLVENFALPLASLTICQLLGVPQADRELIREQTWAVSKPNNDPQAVAVAFQATLTYLEQLVCAKQKHPSEDDLVGRLIIDQVLTGAVTLEEVVGMTVLLLVAGQETTTNMAALGTLALLRHPQQFAQLRAKPELAANATEELLRFLSIADFVPRVALEDIEIGGQRIRAGEGILAVLGSANRDAAAFIEANRLDIHRSAQQHLAFGYGVHLCVGASLARIELQAAYAGLAQRIPTLRLAVPEDQVCFKYDIASYGLHALPVTW